MLSSYKKAMPTYQIRSSSNLNSHVEYEITLWGTDTVKSLMILTETILPYTNLTGTLSLGLELTEADSGETGEILWFTDTQIGLGVVSGEWVGNKGVTGSGVTLDGGAVQNILERTSSTLHYQLIREVIDGNTSFTTDDDTVYIDVKNTEKVIFTNLNSAGYIKLYNESTNYPLTGWITPHKTLVLNVNHRIRKLIVRMSQAGLLYSLALEGAKIPEITLQARRLQQPGAKKRRVTPPKRTSSRSGSRTNSRTGETRR